MRTQPNHIIVSVSGGKDSSILMLEAEKLKAQYPSAKFHYVHAVIDIDWNETIPVLEEQAKYFGVKIDYVQAVDKNGNKKGFISQLLSPRIDRKTGETKEYMVPDSQNRWCTSMLKIGPINKFARKLKGEVVILIGERRAESSQRAKLESWRPLAKESLKDGSRNVYHYSPILDWSDSDVWQAIKEHKLPVHPCYSWGVSRASCAICIFSSPKEIKIAHEKAPHIVKRYVDAMSKLSTSFRYKAATKTKPAQKVTLVEILASQGVDVNQYIELEDSTKLESEAANLFDLLGI